MGSIFTFCIILVVISVNANQGQAYFVPPRGTSAIGEETIQIEKGNYFTSISRGQLEALLLENILTRRIVMDKLAEMLGTAESEQQQQRLPYNRA
eukprot:08145.XXX_22096_22380_1 [CDS] Oithona nana genome sequencing.